MMSKEPKAEVKVLTKVAHTVLGLAKKLGASQAEVDVESDEGLSLGVRVGELETLEFHQGKAVSVRLYLGKRSATASTTDLSLSSLTSMVQAAHNIAQYGEEDSCYGLADEALMAENYPDLDRYYPWKIDTKSAIKMAIESEKKALLLDKRIINSDGVALNTQVSRSVYANSHGFSGSFSESSHMLSCSLVAQDGQDMQRGSYYTYASSADHLKSMDEVADLAAQKALRRLNPKKLKTQKTSVVFDSEIASHILSSLISAISGGNLYRQSSFLLDHMGKIIFPDWIDIIESPHEKNVIGSVPFDAEGVLTRKKHFVREGVLESYVLGSYSARRLGLKTTANAGGVFNLSINACPAKRNGHVLSDQKALLKKMGSGVLVTSLMGSSVSILTGDYSRGATGFWVENGEIQYPVNEFTIASNLKEMFKNIQAIAGDVDTRKNIKTGSILISDMMIAGE